MNDAPARIATKMADLAAAEALAAERAAKARSRANAARVAIAVAEEKSRAVVAAAAESRRKREIAAAQAQDASCSDDESSVATDAPSEAPLPTEDGAATSAAVNAARRGAEDCAAHAELFERRRTEEAQQLERDRAETAAKTEARRTAAEQEAATARAEANASQEAARAKADKKAKKSEEKEEKKRVKKAKEEEERFAALEIANGERAAEAEAARLQAEVEAEEARLQAVAAATAREAARLAEEKRLQAESATAAREVARLAEGKRLQAEATAPAREVARLADEERMRAEVAAAASEAACSLAEIEAEAAAAAKAADAAADAKRTQAARLQAESVAAKPLHRQAEEGLMAVLAAHGREDLVDALKRAGIRLPAQLAKAGDALLTGPAVGLKREELDAIRRTLSGAQTPSPIPLSKSAPLTAKERKLQAEERAQKATEGAKQVQHLETAPSSEKECKQQAAERARKAAEDAGTSRPEAVEVAHLSPKERKQQAAERAQKAKETAVTMLAADTSMGSATALSESAATSSTKSDKFAVGDLVDVKDDEPGEEWEPGTVVALSKDGAPRVLKDGYGKAFSFEQIRRSPLPTHRKSVATEAVSLTHQKRKQLAAERAESVRKAKEVAAFSDRGDSLSLNVSEIIDDADRSYINRSTTTVSENAESLTKASKSVSSDASSVQDFTTYEKFVVGDQVDVKDEPNEEWEPGTVIDVNEDGSALVQKKGYAKAFSWGHVRRSPVETNRKTFVSAEEAPDSSLAPVSEMSKKFEVGDEVEIKDEIEDEWELGIVQDFDDDGQPRVQKQGYDKAFLWGHVRRSPVESKRKTVEDVTTLTKKSDKFLVGDQVDVKDEPNEEWEPGTVIDVNADGEPRVLKEGYDKAFSFEQVRLSPVEANCKTISTLPLAQIATPTSKSGERVTAALYESAATSSTKSDKFAVGDLVDVKDDEPGEEWEPGTVVGVNEDGELRVLKKGYDKAFSFEQVRRSPVPRHRKSASAFDSAEDKAYAAPSAEQVLMEDGAQTFNRLGIDRSMEVLSTWSELTESEDEGIVTPLNVVLKLESTKKDEPEVKNRYTVIQTDHLGKGGDELILAREEFINDRALAEWKPEQKSVTSTRGGYEKVSFAEEPDEEAQKRTNEGAPNPRDTETERKAYIQVMWAIMPPILLLSFFSYIDRCNLAFVSEDLQQHIGLTDSQYGMGAGMFFVGYCVFQVPSQMVLVRVGALNWLGFMAFAWGIACCAMAACTDVDSFYRARFALGATEAGFFPGVISFLRMFLPKNQFGFAYGMIVASMCIAMVCGGPLAALVMEVTGDGEPGGLAGWQWLFLAQGLPAVFLGLFLPCWLPATPSKVHFGSSDISAEIKQAYLQRLEAESFASSGVDAEEEGSKHKKAGCWTFCNLCGNYSMWAFATCFFFHSFGFWGLVFWVPRVVGAVLSASEGEPETLESIVGTLMNATGSLIPEILNHVGDIEEAPVKTVSVLVLCLSAIPYMGAVAGTLLNSWHSDRTGERRWHLIGAVLLGSFGLFLTASTLHQPKANMISLTIAAFGLYACSPPFWGFVNELTPDDQDAAIMSPMINSFGSIGGMVGPVMVGLIHEHFGSYRPVFLFFAWTELMASIPLLYCLRRPKGSEYVKVHRHTRSAVQ